LPKDGDHRLVWALWPLAVADPVAYEQLLAALVPQRPEAARPAPEETTPPWPQSVRLIGRTGPEGRAGTSVVWGEQPIARVACDFSPAALERSLQQSSDDETQPAAVRMQARLMLATLAAAQGGIEAAVGHYGELLAYYQEQADPSMQTVVLLQLGEAYHRQQRLSEARACYERALTPAAAAPVPVCTAMLAKNLGDVAFLQQRYGDAVTCYRTWHRLAGRLGDSAGARTARKLLTLAQQHGGGPR
jgi:tetratricopeptide (TPR) repeat protein